MFPVLGSPVWPAAAILDSSAIPEMILALSSCEIKPFSTVTLGEGFFPFLLKIKKKKNGFVFIF